MAAAGAQNPPNNSSSQSKNAAKKAEKAAKKAAGKAAKTGSPAGIGSPPITAATPSPPMKAAMSSSASMFLNCDGPGPLKCVTAARYYGVEVDAANTNPAGELFVDDYVVSEITNQSMKNASPMSVIGHFFSRIPRRYRVTNHWKLVCTMNYRFEMYFREREATTSHVVHGIHKFMVLALQEKSSCNLGDVIVHAMYIML